MKDKNSFKKGGVAATLLSATLFILSFLHPSLFCWAIFIWLVPLIRIDKTNDIGVQQGFLWGLLVFSLHLSWLAYIVFLKAHGSWRIIVFMLTVIYYSMLSGLFFFIKQKLANYICVSGAWLVSMVSFFYFVCHHSLFFLGNVFDGYPFMCPALPLASYQLLTWPVVYVGVWGLVTISLCINTACSVRLYYFFICIGVFCGGSLLFRKQSIGNLSSDLHLARLRQEKKSPPCLFYSISSYLDDLFLKNKNVKLVVFPESTFPYDLSCWKEYLEAWSGIDENYSILLGGHFNHCGNHCNSVYQICEGKIVHVYHKKHLMPFTERLPLLFSQLPFFKNLFVGKDDNTFSYFDLQNDDVFFINNKKLQVYICSELYFDAKKPCCNCDGFVVLANDTWLGLDYCCRLAFLKAKLFASCHQKHVVYVGYNYAQIINPIVL